MTLLPHLWDAFSRPGTIVRLCFHAPVQPSYFPSRKALAKHCQQAVGEGLGAISAWDALPGKAGVAPARRPETAEDSTDGLHEALETV